MYKANKVGISFGLTSATITTLGLIMGLEAGTGSRLVVVAGILTIAIADSFSDSLGVHIVKESEGNFSNKEVWQATFFTFIYKLIFSLSFLIPILALSAPWSILAAIVWGIVILVFLNYKIAKDNGQSALKMISEHLFISFVVIGLSWAAGRLIALLT